MGQSILLMVICLLLNSQPKSPDDFLWQYRILIVKSDRGLAECSSEDLSQKLKDRKLLVFQFCEEKLSWTNCLEQIEPKSFYDKLPGKNGESIHWVLIGLDGGIKKLGEGQPSQEHIFKLIDAMPMRKSEIRKLSDENF